jgi:hypothetical protein
MVAAARKQLLGVALSEVELCALLSTTAGATPQLWRSPVTGSGEGTTPTLASAFSALASVLGAEAGKSPVEIPAMALMPSLAEVRAVSLPALSDTDARQLLTRNGSRYFRAASSPLAVALGDAPGGTDTRMVAATSATLLQQAHEAAQSVGLHLGGVVPAEAAWGAALPTSGALLVCEFDHSHLLTIADGAVVGVRRFRRGALDGEALVKAVPDGGAVRVLGDASARAETEAVLRSAGVSVDGTSVGAAVPASLLESPEAVAAFGAAAAHGARALRLETEGERTARTSQRRRASWQLAAAGAAALVVAAGVYLWGLNRELDAVRAERALLAPQLGTTLVGRTTVDAAFRQLATLDSASTAAPRWSLVLGAVSRELPDEAFLTGFRGRADTISIDGLAVSAARVFDAVERVPMLDGVHASSPVRRETTAEGDALDRFQLAAQLAAQLPTGGTP